MSNPKYAAIMDLDWLVRTELTLATYGTDAATRERATRHLAEAKAEMFALIDTLTPEDVTEFSAYRKGLI